VNAVAAPLKRGPIMAFILLASAMVAAEATVVATAMPQVIAALGGGELYA